MSSQIQRAAVSLPANIAEGNVEIIWVIISVQNLIANAEL
ncbi:MAG: four helix bundle protein [Trichodesmium sp. St7_bin2_1]|nr:four helix bundle protein [Trichodesmium sp. St7_bin2_1]MDE5117772.1 four helix bundle protein [Trichodesmium sp. St2_bin2_1]